MKFLLYSPYPWILESFLNIVFRFFFFSMWPHIEIQAIIRQITASVTFLPLLQVCLLLSPLLLFDISCQTSTLFLTHSKCCCCWFFFFFFFFGFFFFFFFLYITGTLYVRYVSVYRCTSFCSTSMGRI